MAQGHSVDEYLETIYFLAFPIGEYTPRGAGSPPLASRVAEMLHVSRASAGEMLKRLEAEGLIERGARKEALMTERGRERAERVVRKHRLIERLLTDFMGYTGAEAHERADQLGDTFTDEMIDRIDERLGHPERCPHGWPVDPDVEQAENPELAPLAALAPARARRSCGSPSTTASCCTGSTTRGSCRAPRSSSKRPSGRPGSSGCGSTAATRRSARKPPPASSSARRPRSLAG